MGRNRDEYSTIPFSKSRRFLVDICELSSRKHLIHGLLEVDVTDARRRIQEIQEQDGEAPSFTGFVIACAAKAVDEHKIVHAYRHRRNRLVLFDDVDVATIIEVEVDGQSFPIGHVIRAANRRDLWDIHAELRAVQKRSRNRNRTMLSGGLRKLMLSLPAFLRRFLTRAGIQNPQGMKKQSGTVLVTSVGMFAKGTGWGIPMPIHTLAVTLGGIAEKPGVVAGRIEIRQYLSVTLSFDHDIVDGAPAARFSQHFCELIESGYGLGEINKQ